MNLNHIESFVSVADEGSFSKAANVLFLKQPTVSAHISALEKELKVKLFERNTKEVSLTSDGKLLYRYAKDMVDLENRIKNVFSCTRNEEDNCLYIAASSVPSQYILPQIIEVFSKKYPDVKFKIMEADSNTVIEKVLTGAADIGFTGARFERKNCRYIPFFEDEMVVITPNNLKFRKLKEQYFGKKSSELSYKNIAAAKRYWIESEPFILREEGSGTRKETERLLDKMGLDILKLNVIADVNDPETIKRYVKKGMGISVMSKIAAKEEIEEGKVLCFSLNGDFGKRFLNVVYRNDSRVNEKNMVIKSLRDVFNDIFQIRDTY